MINVKDEVYAALLSVTDNVTDSYPKDWEKDLAIQYMEEDNKVVEYTDMKEQKAYVRYRVDIWHRKSTSSAAVAVDAAIAKLGYCGHNVWMWMTQAEGSISRCGMRW